MEKIINSAMALEEQNKAIRKRNELADTIKEKRSQFDTADIEAREQILVDVENLEKEIEEMDNEIKALEEVRENFDEQEQRMSLMGNVSTEKVEEREGFVVEEKSAVGESKEYKSAL